MNKQGYHNMDRIQLVHHTDRTDIPTHMIMHAKDRHIDTSSYNRHRPNRIQNIYPIHMITMKINGKNHNSY